MKYEAGAYAWAFGSFWLDIRGRRLLEGERTVKLGKRALAVLIALVERAQETVAKQTLLERIWPDGVAAEATLRVHVSTLQKALGFTAGGGRYIESFPGRGYRLTVPARPAVPAGDAGSHGSDDETAAKPKDTGQLPHFGITSIVRSAGQGATITETPVIGRTEVIARIVTNLGKRRLVTITGSAGVGKTTVALEAARTRAAGYPDGLWFVDLAAVEGARSVAKALAVTLGVAAVSSQPLPAIAEFLRGRCCLVMLDNCEHVLEETSRLAEALITAGPRVHVLATSQERLGSPQEWALRLQPLEVPAGSGPLTREEWLGYSAVRLFVNRALTATDARFSDEDLARIAQLCRRLEGNPLAIEITAARLELLGLQGLEAALSQGLHLAIPGQRTKVERHQTLRGALDWSYGLLSGTEQATFRRLGVFYGSFDVESATQVIADPSQSTGVVFEALLGLAGKSLLAVEASGQRPRFRLLETSRMYALEKLRQHEELADTRHRHVRMWCGSGAAEIHARVRGGADWATVFHSCVEDLRAAIHWCFNHSAVVTRETRYRLFALWFEFSFAAEYNDWQRWSLSPGASVEGPRLDTFPAPLQSVLDDLPQPLRLPIRSILTLAQQVPDDGQVGESAASWGLWLERLLKRRYSIAVEIAAAFFDGEARQPRQSTPLLDVLLSIAGFYAGRLPEAQSHAQRALARQEREKAAGPERLALRAYARLCLARILLLRGQLEVCLTQMRLSLHEARASGNLQILGGCMVFATGMEIILGNQHDSRALLESLRRAAEAQGSETLQLWVLCFEAALTKPAEAFESEAPLTTALSRQPLEASQYAECLGSLGGEWMSLDMIARAEQGCCGWMTAEALRVKAQRLLRSHAMAAAHEAEDLLQRALQTAHVQGALLWELRATMSLARLWRDQGKVAAARKLLEGVRDEFTEGFAMRDLQEAAALLRELRA